MNYKSIDEIKNKFNINSDDINLILLELKELRVKCHPDNTNGEFESDVAKEYYHSIESAIKFLTNSSQTSMTINEVSSLVNSILEKQHYDNKKQEEILKNEVTIRNKDFKNKIKTPRITSISITVLLGALWTFPDQISSHPVLSKYIDVTSNKFLSMWLCLALCTIAIWVFTKRQNRYLHKQLRALESESYQNYLFRQFVHTIGYNTVFSKDDFIRLLVKREHEDRKIRLRLILRGYYPITIINHEIANTLSEIIIPKALNKNVIRRVDSRLLTDYYTVNSIDKD